MKLAQPAENLAYYVDKLHVMFIHVYYYAQNYAGIVGILSTSLLEVVLYLVYELESPLVGEN